VSASAHCVPWNPVFDRISWLSSPPTRRCAEDGLAADKAQCPHGSSLCGPADKHRGSAHERCAVGRSLPLLRVPPQLQQPCRFGAQRVSDHPTESDRWAPFHFVTKGACVVELNGRGTIPLSAGDALVLPHGSRHIGPTTPAVAGGPFGRQNSKYCIVIGVFGRGDVELNSAGGKGSASGLIVLS
jgi:hypothetical protein